MVLETQMTLYVKEPDFFRKTSFAPNTRKKGQNWAKNRGSFEFVKKITE